MKVPRRIQVLIFLLGLAGCALFMALLLRHGWRDVLAAIAEAGGGIVVVVAAHNLPLLLDAIAWRVLFPPSQRPSLRSLFWMRWIGESINALVPSAQVGGDIVRARLAAMRGSPASLAAGTVIVDVTLSVFTQVIFTVAGLALLARASGGAVVVRPALVGSLLGALAVAGFYAVQRFGLFRLIGGLASRLGRSAEWQALAAHTQAMDHDLQWLYGRRRAVLASSLLTLISYVVGAGEVWVALYVLDQQPSFAHAFILESLTQGLRSALFLVPGGLGVQEGTYLVVGGLLGIPGDIALALSLIRRVRELAFGIPALIAWQWAEGRRLWRRRSLISRAR